MTEPSGFPLKVEVQVNFDSVVRGPEVPTCEAFLELLHITRLFAECIASGRSERTEEVVRLLEDLQSRVEVQE